MVDLTKSLVSPDATIEQAMAAIEASPGKIVLVVDRDRHLLGAATDGDIRRGLLAGARLGDAIEPIMNSSPRTASTDEDRAGLVAAMRQDKIRHLPIVDTQGRVVDLQTIEDLLKIQGRDNWVVLMAGGEGRRLRPLTEDIPKPMLPVGSKPILETILEGFIDDGFGTIFLSVNYKADLIKEHFGDGSRYGVTIQYLHEDEALGTAGSLSLLPDRPVDPLIVMNGDILTNVRIPAILDFHEEHAVSATMCVREYRTSVPYGVVQPDGPYLRRIDEKPESVHLVNAGIYVLDPSALSVIERNSYIEMTDFMQNIVKNNEKCGLYPIKEYWIDIGCPQDLKRANVDMENFHFDK